MMTTADHDTVDFLEVVLEGRMSTHSLPVQKVLASLASQAVTPRSSSGRPNLPSGFPLSHFCLKLGYLLRKDAVILHNIEGSDTLFKDVVSD